MPERSTDPEAHGALAFLALVFSTTWLFQLPALVAQRFMPLVVVGFFGPLLVALVLAARAPGGLRALFAPLRIRGLGVGWALVALGLSGAIFVAAMGAYRVVSGRDAGPLFHPPASAAQLAAMLVVPFTEQLPWRGFLYPRLARRHGPLVASVATGVAWALFHVQKHVFLREQLGWTSPWILVPFMTAGTVVFTWLYVRTRGSLLVVVLANMGVYLDNSSDALPATSTPLVVHTVGFCIVAVVLVAVDRKAWRWHRACTP
jgi:uncharacterized protein